MSKTKIPWATDSWNPCSGCSKISDGCKFCFAERMAHRLQAIGVKGYENGFEVTLHPERLNEPLKWKKPRRIFVCSMGDLFHISVPFGFIEKVWDTMFDCAANPYGSHCHTFMILTKRPDRMAEFYEWMRNKRNRRADYDNVWLGITVESPDYLWRMEKLVKIPAAKHFISYEPGLECLGDIEYELRGCSGYNGSGGWNQTYPPIDWVIAGCESGPDRRPFQEQWVRDLKDQCVAAGVPFFYKQGIRDDKVMKMPELDGRVWDQIPEGK